MIVLELEEQRIQRLKLANLSGWLGQNATSVAKMRVHIFDDVFYIIFRNIQPTAPSTDVTRFFRF